MSWSKPCFPVGANSNANFWGYSKMLCESCNFWLELFLMIGTRHNWNIRGLEIDKLCPNHIFSNSRVFYQPRSDMVLGWLMFSIANLGPFTPGFPNHPNHPTQSIYPIHPYQPVSSYTEINNDIKLTKFKHSLQLETSLKHPYPI